VFQTVALSLLCAMSLVQLLCTESVECFPAIVSKYAFSPLVTVSLAPVITGIT
jgi:hypothetical protein